MQQYQLQFEQTFLNNRKPRDSLKKLDLLLPALIH